MKTIARVAWLSLPFALIVAGVATLAQNATPSGEITVWGWKDPSAALKSLDAGFTKAYPNIKVNYVVKSTSDVYTQLKLGFAAGSGGPDVSVIEDSNLAQYVELGALADVTDKVKPYLKKMNPYKWIAASKKGRYYSMPWDSGPVALYYRRDVFSKAGVDPASLKTWADYVKAAKVIKDKTGAKMLPLAKARNDARLLETLIWQQGSGYVNKAGAVTIDKDPRSLLAVELLNQLWKNDVTADLENWTDPWYKAIAEGEVATLPMAVWMGGFLKGWIAPKASGQWGIVPLPTFSGSRSRASNDGGSHLAILEQSKNKDAAWAYIEYHLGRPESQLAMFKSNDLFPSLESTYSDPIFSEAEEYFGGQKYRQVFSEAVKTVPSATIYTPDYAEINKLMSLELQKFALGKQKIDDVLKNAASSIRERTRRQ